MSQPSPNTLKSTPALNAVLKDLTAKDSVVVQGSSIKPSLKRAIASSEQQVKLINLQEYANVREYCHQDQVISVETGIKLPSLAQILNENNQFFPCQFQADTTLLDVINGGDCGYWEHSVGGMRALVLGLEVQLVTGELIHTGGKVVKNVSGYDLTKLFVGARGTLGLPLLAHLRLYASAQKAVSWIFLNERLDLLLERAAKLINLGLPLSAFEVVRNGDFSIDPWWQFALSKLNGGSLDALPRNLNALLISVAEHESVISELMPQIESGLAQDDTKWQHFTEKADDIFSLLQKQFHDCPYVLETSLPQKIVLDIAHKISGTWHYRPSNGRFCLYSHSEEQLLSFVNELKKFASEELPLTVAYPRTKFEYLVERLPSADLNLQAIQRQLKNKFDPDNRLNPFAQLY